MIGKMHVQPTSVREVTNGKTVEGYTVDENYSENFINANNFIYVTDSVNLKVELAIDIANGITLDRLSKTEAGRVILLKDNT